MEQQSVIKGFFKILSESGNLPDDSEDEKLRKSSLIVMSLPFAAAGLIWGSVYFMYGLIIPGMIPFNYGILSLLSFFYFRKTKRYKFYRISQIFLILILPFLLQLTLGGFIPSSAVIIWGLISPLSALVFFNTKRSLIWFLCYLALVFVAYAVNDLLPQYFNWGLSDQFINLIFLLNIVAVSSLIYTIQYYFVGRQRNLKKAVEEQAEKLKELDGIKSRFFANISHEFRTPLTLILGMVNKQIANPGAVVNKHDSEIIHRNANRLLELINQLLDLSKLESGQVKLKTSLGDIVSFTKKMFSMFESIAADKRIELTFNGKPLNDAISNDTIELYFDQEKLQKVITNLISNAVKFTPESGTIEVNVSSANEWVKIAVANSGEGISPEALPFIFDRFYQADAESTREHEGTGIGLSLVRELTELHHGSVSAENHQGMITFTVSIPQNAAYLADHEKTASSSQQGVKETLVTGSIDVAPRKSTGQAFTLNEPTEQLEVLVVEDNQDLRSYICSILENEYKVFEAVDGIDGMEKAEAHVPDLIVSDVMMPRMDGYELCKQLKSNDKTNHIPIVLLTAKASRENKLEGLGLGADDYLIKPFDEKELGIRIKNLIMIREQLQKKYQDGSWLKPNADKGSSVHQKFLTQIKEAIQNNLDNDQFSVDDLGTEIAMSRSQVHRKLKALTDLSATAFIRNYRLHVAAELLKQESGTITEIAYQVGFSSQTYFSSSFQELFGCSPSEYHDKFIVLRDKKR